MDWYQIYLNEIELKDNLNNYILYKVSSKRKFINLIEKYSPNKKIIECGCGTAIISTYIASLGYDVTAVDIDKKILSLAKKIAKDFPSSNKPNFIESDITKDVMDEHYDVAFSNGVLEHFKDSDIKKIIKNHLSFADYLVIGIPTKFFNDDEALYGDERFLKLSYWRKLIDKSGGKIIEECSYHYMTPLEKLKSINKIFRPKPFRVFVITKKS